MRTEVPNYEPAPQAQANLLWAAKRALEWFTNHSAGNARNGLYDDIVVGRYLRTAIEAVEGTQTDPETFARELVDRR